MDNVYTICGCSKDEWENTVEWNDKWFGLCDFNESGELAKKKKKKETAKIMLNTTANNAICSKMLQLWKKTNCRGKVGNNWKGSRTRQEDIVKHLILVNFSLQF